MVFKAMQLHFGSLLQWNSVEYQEKLVFKAFRLHCSHFRQGRRLGPRRSWRARAAAVGTLKVTKISRKRWFLKQSGSISGLLTQKEKVYTWRARTAAVGTLK